MKSYELVNWLMENNLGWLIWLMILSAILSYVSLKIKERIRNNNNKK